MSTSTPMHVVLGATGRVGSAVAGALLDRGERVTVVTRDPRRAESFARRGAAVAVADVRDADALRAVLRRGQRAFLLMPPADPATDTVAEERRTMAAIARAVEGAGLEKVAVQSTYGAQPGDGLGDLGVLHALEQAVAATGVPTRVVRGAYFMSNWDFALETARQTGEIPSLLPAELALPMVAPVDLGRIAARWLVDDEDHAGVHHVEGPAPYSAADVARAAAAALGRDIRVVETPRAQWVATFLGLGFSPSAAESYARMTATVVDGAFERPEAPERGPTTLAAYVAARLRQQEA
ncbi:NmrA family NAD(P)-binding protein [Anaeromyxobacter sp. PSR-1]|uniref:NmrA family NAD(P)-binding protein n=1 Tax=Anaeromyxobacter sp. PSR-1 TaxID=1300915 RepID=UPI0005DD2EB6|nr:NmrA family NAD(P)-binding protein [Anaeromyxobacter sp. PSR-1]GAO01544.1 NAD(P)H azoreductase [Anaeromyxobacter sp. PSR-1]